MKKVIAVLVLILVFLFLQDNQFLLSWRGKLEQGLVVPLKKLGKSNLVNEDLLLKVLSLNEQVKKLKAENNILREQLGAIPPLTRLYPAEIIWQSDTQYILNFSYNLHTKLVGKAVVWQEIFLGYVQRQGQYLLVVEKPISSNFLGVGITNSNVQGKVSGEYNHDLMFKVNQASKLTLGNSVYLVDQENGLKLLLGKVKKITQDKRLPVKTGLIDYLPLNTQLSTVFIVI